jgi:hypothetical protein
MGDDSYRRQMRRCATVPTLLLTGIVAACGWGSGSNGRRQRDLRGEPTAEASSRERALRLTRRLPSAYRRVCERQASEAPVAARTCPPLVPVGPSTVMYRGRSLGRESAGGGFSADLASRSLNRLSNGGHWRYDVVWVPTVTRAVVDAGIKRPRAAREPSSCERTRVAAQPMTACRVVPYSRGGGVNGGHIADIWTRDGVAYVISLHGYANEPRARAMMAAYVARVGG